MRKTLATILLGTTLFTTACAKRDRAMATREEAQSGRGHAAATATEQADQAKQAEAPPQADPAGDTGAAAGSAAAPAPAPAPAPGIVNGPMAVMPAEKADAKLSRADVASGSEGYRDWGVNPWTDAAKDRLSTFAADVDTASYTIMRRKLNEGTLPPKAAVRVEEFVNYFSYSFPEPAAGSPFSVVMDAAPSPVSPARHILRVGVATKAKQEHERKPANLVFLVDVSGSMNGPDRIELAKKSLRILTQNLKEGDTVSLVTYAGSTRLALKSTGVEHKAQILDAIDALGAGGSTGMASGIDLAYEQAMAAARPGAISRVIVLSDGDANVGPHTHDEILKRIAGHVKQGVTLSTIGFGMGNYKDELMEQLANKGNGNNFYIDSIAAAKKVFEQQLSSTLEVVAKDAKLQVEFDPALVARYRLVGYENRDVKDTDFRNDKVDAGEIGAGHQVTALYEIELTAQGKQAKAPIASVRIRHKAPSSDKATEAAFPMIGGPAAAFGGASADFRFAFAVAAFADTLRGGEDAEHWSLAQIRDVAKAAAGGREDRGELVKLVEKAIALRGRHASR
ncbi:MAG TPA: von Willebrand factor type A domain-containing protein [Kofleriaceae bacterium]|nr:von Willebrand factor type A domain-containing protein [Kofleriaceae bacterium]